MDKKKVIAITAAIVIITNIATALLVGLGVGLGGMLFGSGINTKGVSLAEKQKYNYVKNLIKTKYVDNVDDNKLMEGSIRGLAEATGDPYTVYMDKEEFESLQVHTKASYAGVGIVVGIDPKTNLIMVSEVIENSPAEQAKILAGDKIVTINDTEVTGDDFEKAVSMIRGESGTQVKISILREGRDKPLDFNVTRKEIELKTIKTKLLSNGVGYVRIVQFAESTANDFKMNVADLRARGANRLVIDLRDNPGGLLDQVVDICGQLLPKELVVYTVDKQGKREDYFASGTGSGIPFVLLINERSASASEILAGAVKDYNAAKLVGTKTFGKGVVQTVFPLIDGSGIKITTSKYFTPKGVSIHKIGIQPDVVVEMPEKDRDKAVSKLTEEEDIQLQKALEVLGK